MHKGLVAAGLAALMAAGGTGAAAQVTGAQSETETVEEAVIESRTLTPRTTFRNASGGETVFYGQFNPAFQRFDDGGETTSNIVDNGNWNSRLGFRITQPLDGGTLRFRFETGLGLRSSAAVWQEFTPEWIDWQRTSLRWFEASWEASYGTISAGQGSSASDGTAGLDESFTFHAGATDSSDGFGAFRFRDGNGVLTDVTIGRVNDSLGGSRRFRLRYDSPSYAGFIFSTSYGRNVLVSQDKRHFYDVAVRWNGDIGDFAVRAAAGYGWEDNPNGVNSRRVAGSVTLVHTPTGLNLSTSAGSRMSAEDYYYLRAGWRTDFIDAGKTSLSVDYYRGRDFLSEGARTENYGLYAVQSFDALSLDVYAGWRRFTYSDRLGGSYQDADGLLVGARWFF